jgi:glycosyltransferase involved in cell wall biosynthesis
MRVLNLCRVLWNGGVQRAAIAQTLALRARGHTCDLLFLRAVDQTDYVLPTGTRILCRPGEQGRPTLASLSVAVTFWFAGHRGVDASVDLDLLWKARTLLGQYDVVIYNDQYAGLLGAWARLSRRQPFVVMFHEFYPRVSTGWGGALLRALADGLDVATILGAPALVATSKRVLDHIDRIAPGRAFLARLGAPSPERQVPMEARDRHSVFSITVWDRGRHPELFLDLARELPQFEFIMAGIWADPTYLSEFRRAAADLPNLTITGPISEPERERLEGECLLYLRLGYGESGPGMGGLEALASGSIVITNLGLGLSECLQDGVNGFVLPGTSPEPVVALLRRIDGMDATVLRGIAAAGQATAAANSWAAHAQVLEQALAQAQGRIPRRGPGPALESTASSGSSRQVRWSH